VNSAPALSTLTVGANIARAKAVRIMFRDRDLLQAPLLPAPPAAMNNLPCTIAAWSDFVKSKSPESAPVAALPTELAGIGAIDIQSDTAGLADHMARDLKERIPTLRVGTPLNPLPTQSDAALDFEVECRCGMPGKPDGWYVNQAVLYKRAVSGTRVEPARVLFYWSDGTAGTPTSDQADLSSFVGSLASSIIAFQDRQAH
jgi:hypothetical protein